jgi:DNA replication protein DnaC
MTPPSAWTTAREWPDGDHHNPGRDLAGELGFLTRALKAPTLGQSVAQLADRARAESWTHEEFLPACLPAREVAARQAHGGEGRIRAARFPARKSLEEFDFDHARSLKRETIAHLGTLDFVTARDNVVFLGPPGTGKTHLAIGLGIRACQAGHRVAFATAAQWVARLADAHAAGRLQAELVRLGRYPLVVVDEVGYIPFEAEAANLFFQLVSARYERVSLIVTSNKPFGRWGEVFGDDVVAAAMIDRLVHHARSSPSRATATGSRTVTLAASPRPPPTSHDSKGVSLRPSPGGQFSGSGPLSVI